MKIPDGCKFKLWGFSTTRMVLVLDSLNILFCFAGLALENSRYFNYPTGNVFAETAANLLFLALIFCFLPPYNRPKLYVCWPLTAFTMILMFCLVSL
jgi:hypothetical protein